MTDFLEELKQNEIDAGGSVLYGLKEDAKSDLERISGQKVIIEDCRNDIHKAEKLKAEFESRLDLLNRSIEILELNKVTG